MAMKRRDFLRATLVTAGAVIAPSACTEDDGGTGPAACPVEPGTAYFPQSVASGDPRPDSVVLWTRIDDPESKGDVNIELQIALNEQFQQVVSLTPGTNRNATADAAATSSLVSIVAEAAFDNCVKVKVAGLQPGTTYYYRFFYKSGAVCYTSPTGRTRTAPAEDSEDPVRFAYVSCQDYIGRYYNTHVALAEEELDFVVFLGDYIYETTGDPSFQSDSEFRKVTFTDTDGAITLGAADGQTFYAARSINNYRELYRTYRSDAALQRVHERFPAIIIWDDHEFSNDCHGATATYLNGRENEEDVERRKAANKAWFEYMPVDYNAGDDFVYDPSASYPTDLTIYRTLGFGKHLQLVLTDLRTYRSDHVIPEHAFPGKIIATQEDLTGALGMLPAAAAPYVNIDVYDGGDYKTALTAAAETIGYDPAHVAGDLSVAFVNQLVVRIDDPALPPINPATPGLKRGISYYDMGKAGFYTAIGARYLVAKDTFDIISRLQWESSSGDSEVLMGEKQENWFFKAIEESTRTWKVWANEYCLVQLAIDLTQEDLPPEFKRRFYLNVDAWDGFRNRRSALLQRLGSVDNVVAITGDIHGFYAGTPMANDDPTKKIVEIVGSSVTSKTFKDELKSQVAEDPVLSELPSAALLANLIDVFLTNVNTKPNPMLGYANSGDNGYCVAEVSAAELVVTMNQIPAAEVTNDYTDRNADLQPLIKKVQFKAIAGNKNLHRFFADDNPEGLSGGWHRWDSQTLKWV